MSSILDALRKLEADKADASAQDDLVLDRVSAERELVGEGLMRWTRSERGVLTGTTPGRWLNDEG